MKAEGGMKAARSVHPVGHLSDWPSIAHQKCLKRTESEAGLIDRLRKFWESAHRESSDDKSSTQRDPTTR